LRRASGDGGAVCRVVVLSNIFCNFFVVGVPVSSSVDSSSSVSTSSVVSGGGEVLSDDVTDVVVVVVVGGTAGIVPNKDSRWRISSSSIVMSSAVVGGSTIDCLRPICSSSVFRIFLSNHSRMSRFGVANRVSPRCTCLWPMACSSDFPAGALHDAALLSVGFLPLLNIHTASCSSFSSMASHSSWVGCIAVDSSKVPLKLLEIILLCHKLSERRYGKLSDNRLLRC
jgi:hypothetical protein